MQLRIQSSSGWRRRLAPSDTRRWFLGAIGWRVELQRDPVWDIVIYWKRLLAALAVLAVAGYLAGVTALYYWWGRQAETRVAWIDLALAPGQPEKFRRMRGERLLALGQSRLEQGQLVEAAFNLQAGLARAPDNLAGRLALTRIWAVLDRARALKTIEDGLARSPHEPALLDALFDLYALMGAEAKALERSAALLAPDRQPPLTEAARRAVTNARASLLLVREPAAALALLATLPADAGSRAGLRSVLLSSGRCGNSAATARPRRCSGSCRPRPDANRGRRWSSRWRRATRPPSRARCAA
ncbi:tetratricopeptide repeat protein [Oleiharenicola sp. Vm1]|uniref:tetratricopeptide repeat protein n=1 Tax=Oleiharenicola sp. Vm1 TaxID=3398393 RepID=UPI0039F49F55